jgi:hypothetical protein
VKTVDPQANKETVLKKINRSERNGRKYWWLNLDEYRRPLCPEIVVLQLQAFGKHLSSWSKSMCVTLFLLSNHGLVHNLRLRFCFLFWNTHATSAYANSSSTVTALHSATITALHSAT